MNQSGPLVVPIPPPDVAAAVVAMERLPGHSTSDLWLPADSGWPALDEIRAEHLRVRQAVLDEINAHHALAAQFAEEDSQHRQAQIDAHRAGTIAKVKDGRTSPEKRAQQLGEIADRMWAGVLLLADVVDQVLEVTGEHLDEWLNTLRQQREPAAEKRREAERLLHEADVEEFGLATRADWLKKLAADGPFGRAPYPQPTPRPKQMGQGRVEQMFAGRHYSEEPPMVSHAQAAGIPDAELRRLADPGYEPDPPKEPEWDDGRPDRDPTGVLQELDQDAGAR